ncbi:MAG: type II toxin-antitoxin system VapC family toxin [Nitrososphaerales archaeon]
MDAFDSDVLIDAAVPGHPLGRRVAVLLEPRTPVGASGTGSLLLLPELLAKSLRDGGSEEVRALSVILSRLELRPLDRATAELATALAVRYGLHAADAVHLATAVGVGADRFITNNRRDFPAAAISEVEVVHPADLPPA